MSKTSGGDSSDDEFQDARENLQHADENSTDSKSKIDELIDKQMNMHLEDDGDEEKEDDDDGAKVTEIFEPAEYMDEIIDEDALRETEISMSIEELQKRKEEADKMKLEGNDFFKANESIKAIEIYTEALKICPTTYTKERAVLYGNRAAAKIQMDSKKSAVDDCTKAIELYPDYVRALIRRAKLLEFEDKLDEALDDYKRVVELDPGHREAREACMRLPPIVAERNEKLKTEMMDKLKDLGNMILKPFGLSTENFQVKQDPNSGSYSINFNQNQNPS